MSFGDSSSGSALADLGVKRFLTEDEVQKEKDRRQAEWERVRKPDDPLNAPEEVHDTRTLFERLEEQKQMKQLEYEEQFKCKNQFRGLEEDETDFLKHVSDKRDEMNRKREEENQTALDEIREAMVNKVVDTTCADVKKSRAVLPVGSSSTKSQSKLLAGAIKRKSVNGSDTASTDKRPRSNSEGDQSSDNLACSDDIPLSSNANVSGQIAKVVGILPGIGDYSNSDDSDSDGADSDSSDDIDTDKYIQKKACGVQHASCGHSH